MTSFVLGKYYTAKFTLVRYEFGYVAKGVVLYLGQPAVIFEARGRTIPDTDRAAWDKAQEVYARLMTEKRKAKRPPRREPEPRGEGRGFS